MNLNKFTEKAQEAVITAQNLATESSHAEITPELLIEAGITSKRKVSEGAGIAVLGKGDLTKALKITAHRVTKGAREKIEKAGGTITIVGAAAEQPTE